jgi:hypothetical protein
MKKVEDWAVAALIAVGLWAAVTPGRQIPSAVPDRYRISNYIPPWIMVAFWLVFAYMYFRSR